MTINHRTPHGQSPGASRFTIALLLGYTFLIVYGTLFPLDNWQSPAISPFTLMLRHELYSTSRPDILTNILVYLPLGLLIIRVFPHRHCPVCKLLIATLASALLSLSLEYLQAYLPGRVPSIIDVMLNTIGGFTGALLALLLWQDTYISGRLRRLRNTYIQAGPLANLGLAVLGLWALSQLSPLVPSLDMGTLRDGLKPLFLSLKHPASLEWSRVAEYALAITALGILSGCLQRIRYRSKLRFAIFAMTVLLLKVPVVSRQLSLEALLGLFIGLALVMLVASFSQRTRLWVATFALLGSVVSAGLYVPADATLSATAYSGFNWVPFRSHLDNEITGMIDILGGLWPFLALSFIALFSGVTRRLTVAISGAVLIFLLMFALEWHQQSIPGRSADITDALLAVLAWLFPWLYLSFRGKTGIRPATSTEPAWKIQSRRQAIVITILATVVVAGTFWQLTESNQGQWLDESKQATLPPPEELPAVDIAGFRYQHPRLPAPSPEDIAGIKRNNPSYFKFHKKRANGGKGKFFSVILTAFVEPGSQDLNLLYRRLMAQELSWRGHVQAKPLAVAYDWLYDQWSPRQRKQLLAKVIEASNYLIEFIRVKQRLSPYNVFLYNSPLQALMATALAGYGDSPDAELPMRWTADYWKNHVLPVWRQVMGNNGGWHEGGEYVGIGIGQAIYQLPAMWRKATAEDLFRSEPGIRGFLDFLIYRTRPDGTHMRWGDASFFDRIVPDRVPLAIEYSNTAAYSLNRCPRPFKPTSWPWGPLTTDALCDPDAQRGLPLQKYLDGIGMIIARSSWDKEATYLTFKAGDNYWSHSHLDQGAFTIFKGGPLAIDSGLYGPTYGADHHMNYTYQTIAHNVITVTDPDDDIPAPRRKKGASPRNIANDGGQRRIGSGWGVESAPLDLSEWLRKSEIYQTGKIEKYYDKDDLVIAISDITSAYTNELSGKDYFSHRTRRVEKYWRTIVYDRLNDAVIVYDNLVSTDPMFRKKSLIHTINEPRLTKDGFIVRIPASERPERKAGRLQASILFPEDANITIIGGKGLEFLVDDINFDESGEVWKKVLKRKKNPPEPGRWRVEISPANAQKRDRFLMVLKPTIENRKPDLRIRRLVTKKAIGSEIKGPDRTLKLLFPNDREGVLVEIEDKTGSKSLNLTLKPEKSATEEGLWQKIKRALGY